MEDEDAGLWIKYAKYTVIDGVPEIPSVFQLAATGYDVFLLNFRATELFASHTTLDPVTDASSFWDFSLAELGLYDVKAAIENAISLNGNFPKAYVVGYN